jgi:pyrimidine-specific ribonucleoside hydrolase
MNKYLGWILSFFCFYSSSLYAQAKSIIIDTDLGYDDWDAMLVVLNNPNISVKAITISPTGEIHAKPGFDSTVRFLSALKMQFIPVGVGRETPLQNAFEFPKDIREQADHLLTMACAKDHCVPEKSAHTPQSHDAVTLLNETLQKSKEPVTILVIGPLTNIAELIQKHPENLSKIANVIIMGGALRVEGNLYIPVYHENAFNKTAEWNIFADAYAAHVVFNSSLPLTLIPTDATNNTEITSELVQSLKTYSNYKNSISLQILHHILAEMKRIQPQPKILYFWDLVAGILSVDPKPNWASFEKVTIAVGIDPKQKESYAATRPSACDQNRSKSCVMVLKQIDQALFDSYLRKMLKSFG